MRLTRLIGVAGGWPAMALVGASLLVGCGKRENTPADAGTGDSGTVLESGDELLKRSDVRGACERYRAALAHTPTDSHAAFGAALSCSLLLPDSPAVTEVLDLCKQPRFDIATKMFGPTGAFAKDREARKGTSTLKLERRFGKSELWSQIDFVPETVRTQVAEPTQSREGDGETTPKTELAVNLRDHFWNGNGSARVNVYSFYETARRATSPGAEPVPLSDGLEVPAEDLDGSISVQLPSNAGEYEWMGNPVGGTVVFKKVGAGKLGDAVEVEFRNVIVEGYAQGCDPCGDDQKISVRLNGSITDAISEDINLTTPFSDVQSDEGPPTRDAQIVAIDACPGLSTEYLRTQLTKLLGDVDAIHSHLQVVLASPDAESFAFSVPGGLFFVDGEIPVNTTDVRVLDSLVRTSTALGRMAVQYKLLSKKFDELIGAYDYWISGNDGSPVARRERGFLLRALAQDLNATFLDRQTGFDLGPARTQLLAALDTARDALTKAAAKPGIFNFQDADAKALASELDQLLGFVKTNLQTPGLQGLPLSPDYRVSLHAAFTTPIDRAALMQASSGEGIFILRRGNLTSTDAYDRNDQLTIDKDAIGKVLEPYYALPADKSSVTCKPEAAVTGCPPNYRCVDSSSYGQEPTGTCQRPELLFLREESLEKALEGVDGPAFINQDALKPLAVLD